MDGGCTVSHANGEHSWTGTDDAVRAPGLHVLSFKLRAWHMGCAPAFQAG
jgi:hypothetical protein